MMTTRTMRWSRWVLAERREETTLLEEMRFKNAREGTCVVSAPFDLVLLPFLAHFLSSTRSTTT